MAWLSILMPTYRGERYLATALASVAEQADDGVECLVVDDGSDDRTLAIAASFADRIDLRVVDGPRKKNWVASTNAALRAARGEFACMLHQDDGWSSGRVAAVRAALAGHPSARLYVEPARLVDEAGEPLGVWRTPFEAGTDRVVASEMVERLLVQNFLAIPAPVFRTEDALAIGGLDESLWYTADWDFWLGLAALGDAVVGDEPHAFFRIHGSSQTIARSGDADAFRRQLTTVLDRHFDRGHVRAPAYRSVERAARLSIETNVLLATLAHRGRPDVGAFVRALPLAHPSSVRRFLRDSRIVDRVGARLVATARGRLLR